MIFKYSTPKGVPYIEFEDGSSLAFPLFMEDKEKGWQWVTFSGKSTESICVSGKGSKKKKYLDIPENITFTTDLSLSSIDKRVKGKCGPLSPITLGVLKKIFEELAPDGWMSRDAIAKLENKLNVFSDREEDEWNEDPTIGDEDDEI
jgi:hypothetical protein